MTPTECVKAFETNTVWRVFGSYELVVQIHGNIILIHAIALGHLLEHVLELLMLAQLVNLNLAKPGKQWLISSTQEE